MAEAVGLALGVASLAGLFGAAVDAFDQIKAIKSFSKDYEFLTIRYDVRRVTLLQWGTAVGLSSASKRTRHPRLDHDLFRPLIERALNCIRMLLTDLDGLRDTYGLQQVRTEDETEDEPDAVALLGTSFSRPRLKTFRSSYSRFLTNIKDRQKNTSFMRKTQWATVSGSEFRNLLRDLDGLIDDLYKLIPVSLAEQTELIREDAAALPKDPEQLELLQEALAENEELSDASSLLEDEGSATDVMGTAPPASYFSSAMSSYRGSNSVEFASVASSKASWITALSYQESFIKERNPTNSNNRFQPGQSSSEAVRLSIHDPWDRITARQAAAQCDRTEEAERLLAAEADVNAAPADSDSTKALRVAAEFGDIDEVERLLAAAADVNAAPAESYKGRTALQAAAECGPLNLVERLLVAWANANAAPGKWFGPPALQAAAEGGHLNVVARLLVAEADVNALPTILQGRTALEAAATRGHINVVERLPAAKADVIDVSNGRTALQVATQNGHHVLIDRLREAGAW